MHRIKKLANTPLWLDATPLYNRRYTERVFGSIREKSTFCPCTIQRFTSGMTAQKNALYFGDTATEQDASKPETTPADTLNGLIGKVCTGHQGVCRKTDTGENLDAALDASKQLRSKINEVIIANEDNAKERRRNRWKKCWTSSIGKS